jgi:hypothetical protein
MAEAFPPRGRAAPQKLLNILSQITPQPDPRETGHIGNRILSGQIRAIRQAAVHDTKEARHFLRIALDAVGYLL